MSLGRISLMDSNMSSKMGFVSKACSRINQNWFTWKDDLKTKLDKKTVLIIEFIVQVKKHLSCEKIIHLISKFPCQDKLSGKISCKAKTKIMHFVFYCPRQEFPEHIAVNGQSRYLFLSKQLCYIAVSSISFIINLLVYYKLNLALAFLSTYTALNIFLALYPLYNLI